MPKISRLVIPGLPHHVVQRGNRNQVVFFSAGDKKNFLKLLREQCLRHDLKIWCYCLMDNHFHLIAVPGSPESLRKAIGEATRKYSCMINARNTWQGSLWQSRFRSFPLDETYLYNCARYVERNPVRAGLVNLAEEYEWSSARAHVFGLSDELLSPFPLHSQIDNWSGYLRNREAEEELKQFRKNSGSGRPLGSEDFLARIEKITGVELLPGKKEISTGMGAP